MAARTPVMPSLAPPAPPLLLALTPPPACGLAASNTSMGAASGAPVAGHTRNAGWHLTPSRTAGGSGHAMSSSVVRHVSSAANGASCASAAVRLSASVRCSASETSWLKGLKARYTITDASAGRHLSGAPSSPRVARVSR